MDIPQVRQAEPADRAAVLSTITLAFVADPVNRWYLIDADRFLTYFPKVVEAFLDHSIEAGTCYVTGSVEGAAIWLPPGVSGDDASMEAVLAEAVPPAIMADLGALFAQFENYHPHDDDCWYLPLIGVDPAHQGKGIGAALMKHKTALLDELGALAYLESSTPRNVPLYQRFGFEIMDEIPFGHGAGIVTPMLRQRRTA